MRLTSISILILLASLVNPATGQKYTLISVITTNDSSYTTDPLARIYTYSSGNLIRYSPAGKKELEFSINNRGKVGYIDAIDPLQILIFYPAYGDVSILDAGFSENVSFSLPSLGYPMSQVICVSPRTGYWLYDPAIRQLIKLNDQLNVVAESTVIDRIESMPSDPVMIMDSGDWVILQVPGLGLMIFDQFGTYYKTIRILNVVSYQVISRRLLVFDGEKVKRIGISDGIIEEMRLPENVEVDNIRVEEGRLVIRNGDKLLIYSYE